ncbi:DNA gyrase subunit A, partial [Akkermansiaceae bacterium]|nr:DNA gyrase subunit A [Akkermansiaceae bacterium]
KGRSLKNVLSLLPEESIAAVLRLEYRKDEEGNDITFSEDSGNVFFATRAGKVKKTTLNDFRNYRKAGTIAIKLDEGNELIGVRLTSGKDDVMLVTHKGMSTRFKEEQARVMGRNSAGVRGIKPREGDFVVGLAVVNDDARLLVASENGIGKRTPFGDYMAKNRGGVGMITMKCTEKTGQVIGATSVEEDDELMLMTDGGQSIRIRVADVRECGRNTQGVKLVTLTKGEKLQAIARVMPDDETAEEESDEASEEGGGSEEAE